MTARVALVLSAGLLVAVSPLDGAAQERVASPRAEFTVQQAAAAREAFRQAGAATTWSEALPHVARAAHAWPTQPAYWVSLARVGARVADTAAVQEALVALGSMGAGAPLLTDTAVVRVARAPGLRDDYATVVRSASPVNGGRVIATLADTTLFAEGVDADPRTGNLYVGSIRHRTIIEVSPNGGSRDLHVSEKSPRVGAILGVRIAADGQHLFATTAGLPTMQGYAAGDSSLCAILKVRIADGRVVQRWDVPVDGARHLLGDLSIDVDGTVYATDSYSPVINILRVNSDTLGRLSHPLFRSLQGVAPIPGTTQLVVADYSHGLLRVDLSTAEVLRIEDQVGQTTLGIDGIILHGNAVVAVQNGVQSPRVVRVELNADHSRVERLTVIDRQPDIAVEPTIGTLWRGGFVYVANSQWEAFDEAGNRREGSALRATTLLCVPLPSNDAPRPSAVAVGAQAAAGRNGTRSTTSAPPVSPACSASEAALP